MDYLLEVIHTFEWRIMMSKVWVVQNSGGDVVGVYSSLDKANKARDRNIESYVTSTSIDKNTMNRCIVISSLNTSIDENGNIEGNCYIVTKYASEERITISRDDDLFSINACLCIDKIIGEDPKVYTMKLINAYVKRMIENGTKILSLTGDEIYE